MFCLEEHLGDSLESELIYQLPADEGALMSFCS